MAKIPNKDAIKNLSAIFSSRCSLSVLCVRIEKKDKTEEIASNSAMIEVNSSMKLFFVLSPI
jgi:hypothetical protein